MQKHHNYISKIQHKFQHVFDGPNNKKINKINYNSKENMKFTKLVCRVIWYCVHIMYYTSHA